LDPYDNIVRFYDLEHDAFQDDVEFYLSAVREGPVLEVGCGSGRLLAALADTGLELYGIDTSAAMLAAATRRLESAANVSLQLASVEELDVPQRFRTVILPLNVLWHIDDAREQLGLLSAIRKRMVRDGLLVVDLSNPHTMIDRESGGEVRLRFALDEGDERVQCFSSAEDHPEEQLLTLSLWYDVTSQGGTVRRTASTIRLRYTYRFELELMLEAAGFLVSRVYGSYDLDPYDVGSGNLLVLAASA
jgi:SAM-dependent methyltransferase